MCEISDKLIFCDSKYRDKIDPQTVNKDTVLRKTSSYNKAYLNQQDALINNKLSQTEKSKLKTGGHNINLDSMTENSRRTLCSNVLRGEYKPITQSLLNDVLIYQIKNLEERENKSPTNNMHFRTYCQIIQGLCMAIKNNFEFSPVIQAINNYSNLRNRLDDKFKLENVEGADLVNQYINSYNSNMTRRF